MKISSAFVTLLTAVAHVKFSTQQSCQGNGLNECRCNFVGGCDVNGNPTGGLQTFDIAPENIWEFAFRKNLFPSFAFLCERGAIAILYDCDARIPLYAATEIKTGDVGREGMTFHRSSTLDETIIRGQAKMYLAMRTKKRDVFETGTGQKYAHIQILLPRSKEDI